MSDKDTKDKSKEQAKAEGSTFAESCPCITSGDLPDCGATESQATEPSETVACCGPVMKGMMARMMGAFQSPAEEKGVQGK